MTDTSTIDAIRARLAAARMEVSRLSAGKPPEITIPARDTNTDVVIAAALDDVTALLAALDAAQARSLELERALHGMLDLTPERDGYEELDDDEHTVWCRYCWGHWEMGETEDHDDNCPVVIARCTLGLIT